MVAPSLGTAWPSASRMPIRTPGSGRPACDDAASTISWLDQSRMRSCGQATEARGDVSVIPQACTSSIPNSSRKRMINAAGG